MKIWYNGVAFHALNARALTIGGESYELETTPEGSAVRRKVTVPVELYLDDGVGDGYAPKKQVVNAVLAVLATSPAVLCWQDNTGLITYVNQEAMVVGHNLPENPNMQLGADLQVIRISFAYYENLSPSQLTTTYTPTGGTALVLGKVYAFRLGLAQTRASELRDWRLRGNGTVSLSGRLLADPKLSVDQRRAWLVAQAAALAAAVQSQSHGLLVHGAFFSQQVRVTSLVPVINQAEWCVEWSLEASYTVYPNEANYQLATYQVQTREDRERGTLMLTLSGTIDADSLTSAQTMLGNIRAVATAGYVAESVDFNQEVVSTPDGGGFLRATFSETYQKLAGSIVFETLRYDDSESVMEGVVKRSYSGSVLATGSTWDAAYQTAAQRAQALGQNKAALYKSGRIVVVDAQQNTAAETGGASTRVTSGAFLVRVEYEFQYELKGSRLYADLKSDVSTPAFGPSFQSVSGYIVAVDEATARAEYAALRALYYATFVRDERVTVTYENIDRLAGVPIGQTYSPAPARSAWGAAVNASETAVSGSLPTALTRQWRRLEFSFSSFVPKGNASLAVQYQLVISNDVLTRKQTTRLRGTVQGDTAVNCEYAIGVIVTALGSIGVRVAYSRERSMEQWIGASGGTGQIPAIPSSVAALSPTPPVVAGALVGPGAVAGYLMGYGFEETYEGVGPLESGVYECEIVEAVTASGTRWVIRPAALDRDVMQACGIQSGTRMLSGFVTAGDEGTVRSFASGVKAMALGNGVTLSTRYFRPDKLTLKYMTIPRTALTGRGANATVVRGEFGFEEVLPNFDAV